MKKILYHTLIIFLYNLFLLIIPLFIFLVSLYSTTNILIEKLPWIYSPFILFSPVLTFVSGYRAIRKQPLRAGWPVPFIMSLIGFAPLILLYLFLSSLWNPVDYLLLIFLPLLLGLFINLAVWSGDSLSRFLFGVK